MHASTDTSRGSVLVVVAAVAFALSFLVVADTAGAAPTAGCAPGVRTVDGHTARVFCGPAKATIHMGGTTLSFANGICEKSGGGYVVNIGTFIAGGAKSKRPYFGLLISKPKAGTYAGQVLSFRSKDVSRSVVATVTLKSLEGGTFSGKAFGGGGLVTGSFRC